MTQPNVLSRNWLAPKLTINVVDGDTLDIVKTYDRAGFCNLINRWKYLLVEKYQASPGQKIVVTAHGNAVGFQAANFAAWELGLTIIVDWPHAFGPDDLDDYRFTMHGPLEYGIAKANPDGSLQGTHWDLERTRLHVGNVITDVECENYPITNQELFNSMNDLILATADSVAISAGSGGTTGLPKRTKATHKDIYVQSQRVCKLAHFSQEKSTLHSVNLHHGASACYYFLPSLSCGEVHYVLPDDRAEIKAVAVDRYKINNAFTYTNQKALDFFTALPVATHDFDVTTLFVINKEILKLVHDKNIRRITSSFGDTTIGYGFFLPTAGKDTDIDTFDKTCVGPKLDDLFDFKIEDGFLYVRSEELGFDWKTSQDKFVYKDGLYYFLGRGDLYRIGNEWLNISEIDAVVTKCFGDENAICVVDYDEQKLYLVIWRDNGIGEQLLRKWFSKTYQHVNLNFVTQDLSYSEYFMGRKIDRSKLRSRIRQLISDQQV